MSMRDDLVVRVSRVTEMVAELDDLKRILVAIDIIVCQRLIDIIDAGGVNEPSGSSKVGGVSGLEELKKKLLDKIKIEGVNHEEDSHKNHQEDRICE